MLNFHGLIKVADAENGFLIYTDVLYKPMFKAFSGNIRLQYFETDGYNSPLYAFESDVLYGYSIPVFKIKVTVITSMLIMILISICLPGEGLLKLTILIKIPLAAGLI